MGSQVLDSKPEQGPSEAVPASAPARREPGELCSFVKRLGCSVGWVDGEKNAKLWSWAHPEHKESAEVFEAAEDCAEHFMRYLAGKLADELSLVAVPRDGLLDVKFGLTRSKSIVSNDKLINQAAALVNGWLS